MRVFKTVDELHQYFYALLPDEYKQHENDEFVCNEEIAEEYSSMAKEVISILIEEIIEKKEITPHIRKNIQVCWDWSAQHDNELIEVFEQQALQHDMPGILLELDPTGQALMNAVMFHTNYFAPNCIHEVRNYGYNVEIEMLYLKDYVSKEQVLGFFDSTSEQDNQWKKDPKTIALFMQKSGKTWADIKPKLDLSLQDEMYHANYYQYIDPKEPWVLSRMVLNSILWSEKRKIPTQFPEKIENLKTYDPNDIALAMHISEQHSGKSFIKLAKSIKQTLPTTPVMPHIWGFALLHLWNHAKNALLDVNGIDTRPSIESLELDA